MNTDNLSSAGAGMIAPETGDKLLELEPIAIIGIGCRLPGGANDADSFWNLLCNSVDAISEVPAERYKVDAFYDPNQKKPFTTVSRWGGFINQRIDEFDANFFGISPREASSLDPLQRWLLEVSWEALEDGGQVPLKLAGLPVGVFIGAFTLDYNIMQFNGSNRELIEPYTGTGSSATILSARLSYFYDFTGPCITLDTACSSSLVGVHLACQSLWNHESIIALAGGVNAMFMPDYAVSESKAGMLSPDGRSKSFDAKANGYVRGEGAAIVVLKPLSQALKDGDQIYATIRGTACNQDGHSNGITVPNGQAQKAAMKQACQRAGLLPAQIQYIEAHGTGTPTGDPVEATAIGEVYGTSTTGNQECLIGSVKTNIGHTEAVAGVAGLIKAVLCIKHRKIPPSLHFNNPNPKIPFDALGVEVVTSLREWPEIQGPARAAINSFGFGGTNAHVIIEAPPGVVDRQRNQGDSPYLLPISAKSASALRELVTAYHDLLVSEKTIRSDYLVDLCYTASLRRSHHPYRMLLVANSPEELIKNLRKVIVDEDEIVPASVKELRQVGLIPDTPRTPITFVFSGMGPQWWGMGQQLLDQEPLFRETVERCDELFQKVAGWSLLAEMTASETTSRMDEYEVAQPANFFLQVGLARLLGSWGIWPAGVVGHSAGEVAAAYVAGVFNLEEAITLVYHRSNLQQRTSGKGKVVAVGMTPDAARKLIAGAENRISIAAINSSKSVALSGDEEALEQIIAPLQEKGIFCRFLNGKVPVHSHYMEPLREDLVNALKNLKPKKGELPFFSTVIGKAIDGKQLDADYWWSNVRQPVLFSNTMKELNKAGRELFVELSPHPVLGGAILECLQEQECKGVVVTTLRRHKNEREQLLTTLSKLFSNGIDVDWRCFFPDGGSHVRTPTYPWQREVHWKESDESLRYRLHGVTEHLQLPMEKDALTETKPHTNDDVHPLLGHPVSGPHPAWELELDLTRLSFLADHRLQGSIAFPGAGYVEMAWAAAKEIFGDGASSMTIEFRKALFFREEEKPILHLSLDRQQGTFRIYSCPVNRNEDWVLHSEGKLGQLQKDTSQTRRLNFNDLRARCSHEIAVSECYDRFRKIGLEYGPTFQGVDQLWRGTDEEALARVRIPAYVARELDKYKIHPAILDVCFQVMAAALPVENHQERDNSTIYMPVSVEEGRVYDQLGEGMWIHARICTRSATQLIGDIFLCNEQGKTLVEIRGCRAVTLAEKNQLGLSEKPQDYYEVNWQLMERQKLQVRQSKKGSWLLFCDGLGVGDQLANLLIQNGEEVVKVYCGQEFVKVSNYEYFLDPTNKNDYQRLLGMVFDGKLKPCHKMVHLWSIEIAEVGELDLASLKEAETMGPISVMLIVQALNELGLANSSGLLWLVTRGAQYLKDDPPEMLAVGQAPVWGLARVIGHQEHHNIWGGIIDLDPLAPIMEMETLYSELQNPTDEDQIALRANRAFVPRLKESDAMASALPTHFRSDATYLITGGLGSLGLLVAGWLVERGARHLILMGRSGLPDREEWGQIQPESATGKRVAAVLELESQGATCYPVSVDVEDKDEIAVYLDSFRKEKRPPIRGVIHSAGVARPQLMVRMDAEEFNRIQRPKTIGSWNLHQVLEHELLDFFILFSSVASVVVSPGQSNYSAGNAFLDSLAHYRRAQGLPALSINFGPWGEIGMATQFDDLNEYFTRRGMYPMTNIGGINALARVFGQDLPQVMILSADWPVLSKNNYPLGVKPRLLSEVDQPTHTEPRVVDELISQAPESTVAETEAIPSIRERLQATEGGKQGELLASYLLDIVAKILRLNREKRLQLSTEDPLDILGLDSMMAIELKNYVDQDLKVDIAVVDLINGSTPSQISEKILLQYLLDKENTTSDSNSVSDLEPDAQGVVVEEVQ